MQILFIDDDHDDFDLFYDAMKTIRGEAVHCIYEENGASALRCLQRSAHLPDYICLDIHMQVMGGVEFLRIIKADKKLKDIPVIVYTADTNANVKQYLDLGAAHFIPKGSSFRDIVANLKAYFG